MKAGTTSLFEYLGSHPNVRKPRTKEIHFFDRNWEKGVRWYARRFPLAHTIPSRGLTLDVTPSYLFDPHAPSRAADVVPNARVVVLLRDPIARAYSHYRHTRRNGHEDLTFDEALARETARTAPERDRYTHAGGRPDKALFRFSYAARGYYADQLARWLEHYPADRVLVLLAERLFADPAASTRRAAEFLGLPEADLDVGEAFNTGGSSDPIPPDIEHELRQHFAPYNANLAHLFATTNLHTDFDMPTDGSWPAIHASQGAAAHATHR